MKQGSGNSRAGDQKREPMSSAVMPGGVANIGLAQGDHADGKDFVPRITPLYSGRGYQAPAIASTSHKCGSQGKY